MPKWSSRSQGEVAIIFLCKFPNRKWSPWLEMWQSLQPQHCIFWQWRFYPIRKTCKKWKWHCPLQWQCTQSCVTYIMQQGYQWKEDELLFSLYLYMYATYKYSNQIHDFTTMGLWKWISCFWYTLYNTSNVNWIAFIRLIRIWYLGWVKFHSIFSSWLNIASTRPIHATIHKTILVRDKIAQIHTNTQCKVIVTSCTAVKWYVTAWLCNGTIRCTFSSHSTQQAY